LAIQDLAAGGGRFSQTAGSIMYISGLFFIIPIAAHHALCGAAAPCVGSVARRRSCYRKTAEGAAYAPGKTKFSKKLKKILKKIQLCVII
jgi:hypothetical protein